MVIGITRNNYFSILTSWGGRIRTYGWRSQSPQPYHLATPQDSNTVIRLNRLLFRHIRFINFLILIIGQEGIRTPDTVVRSHVL